jgi:hypothetical protein
MTDTPEDIVRALAKQDPKTFVMSSRGPGYGYWRCTLCKDEHTADCPWRRAVEWVEANPK